MLGKVLVVEDDDSIRRLLVEVLQGRPQIAVESARDGFVCPLIDSRSERLRCAR